MTTPAPDDINVLLVAEESPLPGLAPGDLEAADDRLDVYPVSNASDALEVVDRRDWDCVLTTYALPDGTGLALCQSIREPQPHLPVVIATADGSEQIASEAFEVDASDYVPLEPDSDPDRLADRIVAAVEKYRSARAVEADQDRLELFFEASPLGAIEWDDDFRIARVNETAEEILGYAEAELVGEPWETIVPDSDRDTVQDIVESLLAAEGGHHSVNENVRKDGERIVCEWHNRVVTDDEGEVLTIFSKFRDITAEQEREAELQRYKTLVENAAGGVFMQDETATYTFVNSHIEERTGYDRSEVVGEDPSLFIPEADIEEISHGIAAMLEGDCDSVTFETEITTKDGEQLPVEGQLALVPGEDGFSGTVGMIRDISERKAHERELKRQKERLEDFASVVSHDLRNPLNVVQGRLELAKEECDSDHLDDATRALERMQALIDDLLTLAREGEKVGDLTAVELADAARGSWQTVETPASSLRVRTDRTIEADPGRLKQLLENFYRNAIEHGGDDVVVTVGDTEDGFFVADDGTGVPEDERNRIFEAGYSTEQEGTGFGLSIVEQVASAHGWTVEVTESADGGARFEIGGVTGS